MIETPAYAIRGKANFFQSSIGVWFGLWNLDGLINMCRLQCYQVIWHNSVKVIWTQYFTNLRIYESTTSKNAYLVMS